MLYIYSCMYRFIKLNICSQIKKSGRQKQCQVSQGLNEHIPLRRERTLDGRAVVSGKAAASGNDRSKAELLKCPGALTVVSGVQ